MTVETRKIPSGEKYIVKKCHVCGEIMVDKKEQNRCSKCSKSFLPLNYFGKVHAKNSKEFNDLFSNSDEIHEQDLIKGLMVIW